MIDITGKATSLRTARASGKVLCDEATLTALRADKLPKGDPFGTARAAGFLAAKQTAALIPHCHPISIDGLRLDFQTLDYGILIEGEARTIGRTGIEMEILTAVSVAALTLYDLFKPLKGELSITDIRLEKKTGGRSALKKYARPGLQAAVLVCSDSTAAGKREDNSGKVIKSMLESYGVSVPYYEVVPDEAEQIQAHLRRWAAENIPFIFTTGGTGLSPRDRTVEAVRSLIDRDVPGIAEAMRAYGQERTPVAMHSRSLAGVMGDSLVITLPGSSNGARESLEALLPAVLHATNMIHGGGHG